MTAPAFIYTSEPWAVLSFGRPIFAPSVHTGANECGSFAPVLFRLTLHGRRSGVLHFEPIGRATGTVGRFDTIPSSPILQAWAKTVGVRGVSGRETGGTPRTDRCPHLYAAGVKRRAEIGRDDRDQRATHTLI
jgi:hypothetical protein